MGAPAPGRHTVPGPSSLSGRVLGGHRSPVALPSWKGREQRGWKVVVVTSKHPLATTVRDGDHQKRLCRVGKVQPTHDRDVSSEIPYPSGELPQASPEHAAACEEQGTHHFTVPCSDLGMQD